MSGGSFARLMETRMIKDEIVSTVYDGKPRRLYKQLCKHCGKEYYAPKHRIRSFCSIKCAHDSKKVFASCAVCGVEFSRSRSKLKAPKNGISFCTRLCKEKAQSLASDILPNPEHYGDGLSSYRDVAFRSLPHNCNRCGYNEVVGILKVHHKDRDRQHNAVENLEILCPNCHDLEHYRNKDGPYCETKRGRSASGNTLGLHPRIGSSTLPVSTKKGI